MRNVSKKNQIKSRWSVSVKICFKMFIKTKHHLIPNVSSWKKLVLTFCLAVTLISIFLISVSNQSETIGKNLRANQGWVLTQQPLNFSKSLFNFFKCLLLNVYFWNHTHQLVRHLDIIQTTFHQYLSIYTLSAKQP